MFLEFSINRVQPCSWPRGSGTRAEQSASREPHGPAPRLCRMSWGPLVLSVLGAAAFQVSPASWWARGSGGHLAEGLGRRAGCLAALQAVRWDPREAEASESPGRPRAHLMLPRGSGQGQVGLGKVGGPPRASGGALSTGHLQCPSPRNGARPRTVPLLSWYCCLQSGPGVVLPRPPGGHLALALSVSGCAPALHAQEGVSCQAGSVCVEN